MCSEQLCKAWFSAKQHYSKTYTQIVTESKVGLLSSIAHSIQDPGMRNQITQYTVTSFSKKWIILTNEKKDKENKDKIYVIGI